MNINGGEAKQRTTIKHEATNPVRTNDGTKIIINSRQEYDDDVKTQAELTKEEKEKLREEKEKQPLIVNELKYKSDAQGFHDEKRSQLIMYDLENDTLTQLTKGQAHHSFQDISPDDKYILFSANLNEEADYELTNDLYFLNTSTRSEER